MKKKPENVWPLNQSSSAHSESINRFRIYLINHRFRDKDHFTSPSILTHFYTSKCINLILCNANTEIKM